jgi:hypothetical protein
MFSMMAHVLLLMFNEVLAVYISKRMEVIDDFLLAYVGGNVSWGARGCPEWNDVIIRQFTHARV